MNQNSKSKNSQNVTDKISASWLQIEREKSQLVAAINNLTVGFLLTDDHNNIVTFNPAAEKLLKGSQQNWNLTQIQTHIKDKFDLVEKASRCLNNKEKFQSDPVAFDEKFLKFFLSPIEILKTGLAVLGISIIIVDVTREKIVQENQLDFLAIANHEIKAPLTIIRGDIELMLKAYPQLLKENKLKVLMSEIQEEAIRSIGIAHDFLNMARLEEGKVELKRQIFSMPKLIEEVLQEFLTIAQVKGLYLKLEPPDSNLPGANADPDGTKHVLFNLIDNAIKYTQKGGITISLEAKPESIQVRVADTGMGVAKDKQTKLFEKFIPQGPQKSSGLGLYIAKLFAQSMGGKIQLEKSQENIGSTFLFTVPATSPTSGSIIVTLDN